MLHKRQRENALKEPVYLFYKLPSYPCVPTDPVKRLLKLLPETKTQWGEGVANSICEAQRSEQDILNERPVSLLQQSSEPLVWSS